MPSLQNSRYPQRVAALITTCLLAPAPATAEDAKPAISFKSKSIELAVTIDDALKAHPGLYGNLPAEGKREAAKWRADADKARARKEAPFGIGGNYEFNRSYTQRSAIGRYVGVLRGDAGDQRTDHDGAGEARACRGPCREEGARSPGGGRSADRLIAREHLA
jgi:hypothetical protein